MQEDNRGSVAVSLTEYLTNPETQLPNPLELKIIADSSSALLQTNGGATVNSYFGDLSGQEFYAVSLYPERTQITKGRTVASDVIIAFARQNADLLTDPRNSIGLWFDTTEEITFLDVTATLPDRSAAVTLGTEYNQIAIFDLLRLEEIEIGGTGEEKSGWPPLTERLPRLDRPFTETSSKEPNR